MDRNSKHDAEQRIAAHGHRVAKQLGLAPTRRRPGYPRESLRVLVDAVAKACGVRPADLRSTDRHAHLAWPRLVAVYLGRKQSMGSFADLAAAVGRTDHTTAMSAVRSVARRMAADPDARAEVCRVEAVVVRLLDGLGMDGDPEPYDVAEVA